MRLLIGVDKLHRRQGIATALLMRCITMARHAGARYLVLDDVDVDSARFARLVSADLICDDGECQGWIEIAPLPAEPSGTPHLATTRHA